MKLTLDLSSNNESTLILDGKSNGKAGSWNTYSVGINLHDVLLSKVVLTPSINFLRFTKSLAVILLELLTSAANNL